MSKRKKSKYFSPAKPAKAAAPPKVVKRVIKIGANKTITIASAPAKADVAKTAKADVAETAKADVAKTAKADVAETAKADVAKTAKVDVAETAKADVTEPVDSVTVNEPFACPDVSVVIPMYNAETYIGETLESILAQTFKNFELIVVDDCSSDNSPAIVDSFIPKFGGRLTHFRLKKNSGGAGIPRNTGITLARGKYIRFIDSDDRITENALEEDFKLAEEYNADVVYHTLYYTLSADGTESELARVPKYKPGDEVSLDDDLVVRVREIAQNKYYHAPWRSFSRRDFLVANELYFPNIRPYEDIVWNHALLIYAERLLRVPTAVYFYRDNENSMLRTEKSSAQNAKFYLNPIILGLKSLDTYLSRHEFFETKPQLYYAILENYFNGRFTSLFRDSSDLPSFELYETLKTEFGKSLGKHDVLIPALCAALAQQQKVTASKLKQFKEYVVQSGKRIAELEDEINRCKNKN